MCVVTKNGKRFLYCVLYNDTNYKNTLRLKENSKCQINTKKMYNGYVGNVEEELLQKSGQELSQAENVERVHLEHIHMCEPNFLLCNHI